MKMRKILVLVAVGLVLRILTAALLYHTDVKAIYRDTREIKSGVAAMYKNSALANNPLPYPPLVYIFFNTYQTRMTWIFSSYFDTWMADWGTMHTENHPKIFRDLLAMKLPMLLADLLAGFMIWKMTSRGRRDTALVLWILNPITLYAIYGTGQFDIFPTLFVLVTVYLWGKKLEWLAYPLVGLAGGLKLFPLLLLPVFLLIDKRKPFSKLLGFVSASLCFGLTLLPAGLSPDVVKGIFTSNLAGSMFKAGLDLGNGAFLPISLFLYAGFLIYLWLAATKPRPDAAIVIVLLLALGLTRFHPQWIIWPAPFMVIMLAEGRIDGRLGLWLAATYLGTVMLISDKFTNWGLFKAVNNAFDSLESFRYYLDKTGIGGQAYGFFVASFLAGGAAITVNLLSYKKVIVDWGKINFLKNIYPLIGVSVAVTVAFFVLAHIPLTLFGKYLDSETSSQNMVITLGPKTVLTQEIEAKNNNINSLQVLVKNVSQRSKCTLVWELADVDGNLLAQGEISSRLIGDDFDLTLPFARIANSAGKTYFLKLTSPDSQTAEELIIPYDKKITAGGLKVDGKTVGNLAYRTFFNPGGLGDNLVYSLKNIVGNKRNR